LAKEKHDGAVFPVARWMDEAHRQASQDAGSSRFAFARICVRESVQMVSACSRVARIVLEAVARPSTPLQFQLGSSSICSVRSGCRSRAYGQVRRESSSASILGNMNVNMNRIARTSRQLQAGLLHLPCSDEYLLLDLLFSMSSGEHLSA
jgi:hypothetical protein